MVAFSNGLDRQSTLPNPTIRGLSHRAAESCRSLAPDQRPGCGKSSKKHECCELPQVELNCSLRQQQFDSRRQHPAICVVRRHQRKIQVGNGMLRLCIIPKGRCRLSTSSEIRGHNLPQGMTGVRRISELKPNCLGEPIISREIRKGSVCLPRTWNRRWL